MLRNLARPLPPMEGGLQSQRTEISVVRHLSAFADAPCWVLSCYQQGLDEAFRLAGRSTTREQSPAFCLGDAEEAANCFHELGNRNRLRQIGLAATLPYALLVAIHRKCRDGDNRDPMQFGIVLDPLRDLEPRNVGQLYVHQAQVRTTRTRKLERLNSAARPHDVVAV